MNIPVLPLFLGNDAILTDAEGRQVEHVLEHKEEIVASLDAQIALAIAARDKLIRQRNEAHQLLVSNQAPGDVEPSAIRAIISAKNSELDRLRSRIADAQDELTTLLETENSADDTDCAAEVKRCQSVLEYLVGERDKVTLILETHQTSLSPARRLPPEILSQVFLHCLPDKGFVRPAPLEPPLLLGNLCTVWRSVALSTPGLWSSISICVAGTDVRPHEDLIKLWVGRSGSYPLSFRILQKLHKRGLSVPKGHTTIPSLLDIFIPHHARWWKIHLEYTEVGMETGFSKIPNGITFPHLENFHLERSMWFDSRDLTQIASMIQAAPRLQKLSWISPSAYHDLNIPWAQLTLLNLTGCMLFADHCLGIMQDCPMLKTGSFVILGPLTNSGLHPFTTPQFVHHSLEILDIRTQGDSRVFFERLTFPHLKSLSIEMGYVEVHTEAPQRMWPHVQFMDLLSRSECSLESLSLSNADITPPELIACLQFMSLSLKNLLLSADTSKHTCVTDEVLQSLTFQSTIPDVSPLCPNLVNIKLWGSLSSSDGVLASMIESRWWTCCPNYPVAWPDLILLMLKRSFHSADISRLEALDDQSRISLICI